MHENNKTKAERYEGKEIARDIYNYHRRGKSI